VTYSDVFWCKIAKLLNWWLCDLLLLILEVIIY